MSYPTSLGKVFLVGAGPGDPELLTLKAVRCLQSADVVVYDRLVNEAVLDYATGERICVGKTPRGKSWRQDDINSLLVRLGRHGRSVVRLKGGDPFVFGRGGEEADALASAGVACEVVPGISSALAAPASAGIPVTHRGTASSVTIVSGHAHPSEGNVDWATLAKLDGTLVIMMGVANLAAIAVVLQQHGMSHFTPVAVIHDATSARQKVVLGTLDTIANDAAALGSPSVIVVGHVASRCASHDVLAMVAAL